MNLRQCLPIAAAFVFLTACGCGGPLVSASGRLTHKGQPVPSTIVTFWPEEEGKRASVGVTDDDGNFKLKFSTTEDGVYRGKHIVFLKYYVTVEEELNKIPPKASKDIKAALAKYGDVKTSPLRYEITKGGQHFDIAIE